MNFIKIITYMLAAVTFIFVCNTFLGKDKEPSRETTAIVNVAR